MCVCLRFTVYGRERVGVGMQGAGWELKTDGGLLRHAAEQRDLRQVRMTKTQDGLLILCFGTSSMLSS